MSYMVQDFVWGIDDLDPSSKFVLLAIASAADNNGVCWPSASFIQKQTGLNIKTVRATLKKLELAGYLIRDKRPGGSDMLTIRTVYPKTGIPETGYTQNREYPKHATKTTKTGYTQNREYPKTDVDPALNRVDTLPKLGHRISKEYVNESVNKEKEEKEKAIAQKRGTQFSLEAIPDDWAKVAEELAPDIDPQKAFDDFADYWRGIPGEKGRKKDWMATWRNSLRNIPEWKRKNLLKANAQDSGKKYREPWDEPGYYGDPERDWL